MLHFFCAIALLFTQVSGQGSYFVGLFQGTHPWGYPFDLCVPSGVLEYPYVMFTCSEDGKTVTQYVYGSTEASCSKSAVSTKTFTDTDAHTNGLYAFYCNGTNDYFATDLQIGACGSSTNLVVYNAINNCYKVKHTNSSGYYAGFEQIQCNADRAIIHDYAYLETYDTCDTLYAILANTSTISTTCAFYLSSSGISIYAQLYDCVYNGYSQFPQTVDNGATYPKPEYPLQVINLTAFIEPLSSSLPDPDLCGIEWLSWINMSFPDSYIEVTTQCFSDEGVDETYAKLLLEVSVTADHRYLSCNYFNTSIINATFTNYSLDNFYIVYTNCSELNFTLPPTPSPTTPAPTSMSSSSGMATISLIVVGLSLLVSMYIL